MGAPNTTPGPWKTQALAVMGDNQQVASCHIMRRAMYTDGLKEARANALQSAASPELYEACEYAAIKFREYEQMHAAKLEAADLGGPRAKIEEKVARNREAAKIMEAACAKARGEG